MENGFYEVTLQWTKGYCAPDDVEYNLTVTDASSQEHYITHLSEITVKLNQSITYMVYVRAQHCNGAIMSETSNILNITGKIMSALGSTMYDAIINLATESLITSTTVITPTKKPITPTDGESSGIIQFCSTYTRSCNFTENLMFHNNVQGMF